MRLKFVIQTISLVKIGVAPGLGRASLPEKTRPNEKCRPVEAGRHFF
jgi:hypothetical protein